MMVHREDVVKELKLAGFTPNSSDEYDFTGDMLYARIVGEYPCFTVHFAERKTFDRWANSVNFVVDVSLGNIDLRKCKEFAEKICKSNVFDFGTYIHPIQLDEMRDVQSNQR